MDQKYILDRAYNTAQAPTKTLLLLCDISKIVDSDEMASSPVYNCQSYQSPEPGNKKQESAFLCSFCNEI